MATEITKAGAKAAMDLSLSGAGFSVSLKIDNVWLAGAVSIGALSLGAFYLVCKGPSENAIKRALERKIFGTGDPEVTNVTDGHSILVELHCHTETSLLLFLEDVETKTVKFRLEEEFKKIGFKEELVVSIRNAEKVNEHVRQIRERFKAGQQEVNQNEDWKQKYEELAKATNKIYEIQAPVLHLPETQTITPSTKEPIKRLQELATLLNDLTQRERCVNDSNKRGGLEVLELKDLLEEVKNLKETLRREIAISKGLRRTIEKLQEDNKALAKTTKHERVEESNVMTSDIPELREKVHELEKENELLQQKLTKKDKELERFQGQDTDDATTQARPRASSATSLGASSGYQSEEEPDESNLEIIQMPQSQAIQEGKKLVLSCRIRGLPDVRYRWVKDDVEIPGVNRSDLVLEPVEMQDFGRYFCRVWDKSGSVTSDTADIDVFPATQMRFRGLHEMDQATKQVVSDLLSKKRLPGLATWKQVARRYAMRETEISLLEIEKSPASAMLDRLASLAPNLTVYYLCKTFKEPGLRRQDVVNILSKQIVVSIE